MVVYNAPLLPPSLAGRRFFIILILLFSFSARCHTGESTLPRTVLLLTSLDTSGKLWYSHAHQFGAMPLEYLGLKVEYADPSDGLPELTQDHLGIVLFHVNMKDHSVFRDFIRWANRAMDAGKKVVVLDSEAFDKFLDLPADLDLANSFYRRLGLFAHGNSVDLTYSSKLQLSNDPMLLFEAEYPTVLPVYRPMSIIKDQAVSILDVADPGLLLGPFSLISLSKTGGYAATDYAYFQEYQAGVEVRKWYINPFNFFKRALGLDDGPVPDVTTMAGRRIFYSHIDGDGWNNFTEIADFDKETLSAQVIKEEIIKKNPDLPVTVGVIGADIDPDCHGNRNSIKEAIEILSLPQVEAASHTYSHPFFWEFFEDYTPEKEEPFLFLFPDKTFAKKSLWNSLMNWIFAKKKMGYGAAIGTEENYLASLKNMEALPRAYACHPFNLNEEIGGVVETLKGLVKGKKIPLIQWSGDCRVFKSALQLAKELGLENINGGDSRYDSNYPSYSWIRPLCINHDGLIQVYSSMSNENTYTNLWSDRFYAFNELKETLDTTGLPIRLRPINLYYHMYSGEKTASLAALRENISFIRSKSMIPIRTSLFAGIVQDFNRLSIEKIDSQQFKIFDRGRLQTVRFDRSSDRGVDFSKAKGVIGERHFAGSLYVYLDEAFPEPLVALKPIEILDREPVETQLYLIESNYQVKNLKRDEDVYSFEIEGFGGLVMRWNVPDQGNYGISFTHEDGGRAELEAAADGNRLLIVRPQQQQGTTLVKIKRI